MLPAARHGLELASVLRLLHRVGRRTEDRLLRITTDHADAATITMCLEGRIEGQWVDFLERECLARLSSAKRLLLDFKDVTFVSRTGLEMLGRLMKKRGITISAPPILAAVLERRMRSPSRGPKNGHVRGPGKRDSANKPH